jgi:2'-5' RNA ligase
VTDPLVLTALLAAPVQERLDALRRAHFPPDRNHLAAHVTLFHALPGEELGAVRAAVEDAARREPVPVRVAGVRLLGRGVAFRLESPELLGLRAALAREWAPWLTPQDARKAELHVTVQNKVEPAAARALHAELSAGFAPEETAATGLGLWRYRGGPWEPVARVPFRA